MESKRLPGKPLKDINGKSMIQRVYESAMKCGKINDLIIATPNDEIYSHVKGFNGEVIKTSDNPINGTERVYEAYKKIDDLREKHANNNLENLKILNELNIYIETVEKKLQ